VGVAIDVGRVDVVVIQVPYIGVVGGGSIVCCGIAVIVSVALC